MNILIVEDEQLVRQHLAYQLKESGYNPLCAANGQTALHYLTEYHISLAIIDLGLPDLCGIALIEKIRAQENPLSILVLTSRDNWRNKVTALNAGADDYLVKPFEVEELKARMSALLRRARGFSGNTIGCGPMQLDSVQKQLRINDQPVELTHYEYLLIEYFLLNQRQVLDRTTLEDCLYQHNQGASSNVLEVLINRLRQKLEKYGGIKPIITIRGMGYKFELPNP